MIKSITIRNNNRKEGEGANERSYEINIPLIKTDTCPYYLIGISGLGPVKADIKVSEISNLDGGLYGSGRQSYRNIVISLVFDEDFKYYRGSKSRDKTNEGFVGYGNQLEYARHELYKDFPVNKPITILFETTEFYSGNENSRLKIDGYVESIETDSFTSKCSAKISIICPYPYFMLENDIVDSIKGSAINELEFGRKSPNLDIVTGKMDSWAIESKLEFGRYVSDEKPESPNPPEQEQPKEIVIKSITSKYDYIKVFDKGLDYLINPYDIKANDFAKILSYESSIYDHFTVKYTDVDGTDKTYEIGDISPNNNDDCKVLNSAMDWAYSIWYNGSYYDDVIDSTLYEFVNTDDPGDLTLLLYNGTHSYNDVEIRHYLNFIYTFNIGDTDKTITISKYINLLTGETSITEVDKNMLMLNVLQTEQEKVQNLLTFGNIYAGVETINKDVINTCDKYVGCVLNCTFLNNVNIYKNEDRYFYINNITTNEKVVISSLKYKQLVGRNISENDKIVISSIKGNKQCAIYTRDGKTLNGLYCLVKKYDYGELDNNLTTWIELAPGVNNIEVSNGMKCDVTYSLMYEGI